MKAKGRLLFWTDLLNALLLLALMATGSIIKWVLPPGSGGGGGARGGGWGGGGGHAQPAATLWDLTRHQWGDVHFWIAIALIAGLLLHLALHAGWIRTAWARNLHWPGEGALTGTSRRERPNL